MTFTLGRGTEIVVAAIRALSHIILFQDHDTIFKNFASYWRKLTSETQLRWLGPEKGVIHLATAAIVNALWDLWARIEEKPVWKLLVDMEPEQLVSVIDFRYISEVITKEEAIEILQRNVEGKSDRETFLRNNGYPAYTTQVGWLGYSDDKVKSLCEKYLSDGFTGFKIKVGENVEDDKRRCGIVRDAIGSENYLMIDANQRWDVLEAIAYVKELAPYKPLWIEEPTSPDDILGHATISKALKPFGIGVASGEMVSNRVIFKQLLQSRGIQYCQIDSCRLGSINENLAVYLMAKKLNVPVCPHAGGVGLCEMVQHLQFFDYICLSATIQPGQFIEYVDDEHDHFTTEITISNGNYMPPEEPGYSVRFKEEIFQEYEYPRGTKWSTR
ncbi:mitochondrial enolase superfamily member 1-like isoform X2 [Planococcus citri]